MKTVENLIVGDTVWIGDANGRGVIREGTIAKIGTKLITLAGGNVYRKADLRRNDAYGHQWLILDKEAEQKRLKRARLLVSIANACLGCKASFEDVAEAAKLLGVAED